MKLPVVRSTAGTTMIVSPSFSTSETPPADASVASAARTSPVGLCLTEIVAQNFTAKGKTLSSVRPRLHLIGVPAGVVAH